MDIRDSIQNMSMQQAQGSLMQQVSLEVADMSIEKISDLGEGVVEMMDRSMMENSVTPYLGGNIDIQV